MASTSVLRGGSALSLQEEDTGLMGTLREGPDPDLADVCFRDRKLRFYFRVSLSHNLNGRDKENETNAVSGQSDHS